MFTSITEGADVGGGGGGCPGVNTLSLTRRPLVTVNSVQSANHHEANPNNIINHVFSHKQLNSRDCYRGLPSGAERSKVQNALMMPRLVTWYSNSSHVTTLPSMPRVLSGDRFRFLPPDEAAVW